MNEQKYRGLTGLIDVKIRVNEEVLKALLDQDRDNPNGPKASFVARLIVDQAFAQGLIPGLVASGRNKMYSEVK